MGFCRLPRTRPCQRSNDAVDFSVGLKALAIWHCHWGLQLNTQETTNEASLAWQWSVPTISEACPDASTVWTMELGKTKGW